MCTAISRSWLWSPSSAPWLVKAGCAFAEDAGDAAGAAVAGFLKLGLGLWSEGDSCC